MADSTYTLSLLTRVIAAEGGNTVVIAAIAAVVIGIVFCVLLVTSWKKASPGSALVRTGMGNKVALAGMFVFPIVHSVKVLDVTSKRVDLACRGDEAVKFASNQLAEADVLFDLGPSHSDEQVAKAISTLGIDKIESKDAVSERFTPILLGVVTTTALQFDLAMVEDDRASFERALQDAVDLETEFGYTIHRVTVGRIEAVVAN